MDCRHVIRHPVRLRRRRLPGQDSTAWTPATIAAHRTSPVSGVRPTQAGRRALARPWAELRTWTRLSAPHTKPGLRGRAWRSKSSERVPWGWLARRILQDRTQGTANRGTLEAGAGSAAAVPLVTALYSRVTFLGRMCVVFLMSKIILRSWNYARSRKFSVLHMARREEAIETQKSRHK